MDISNYKILIVDDEPDIKEFLGYNLKKEGVQVSLAKNGLEALKIAKEEKPHLILLDVMMPEMDGIETCEELRKIHGLDNTLIAMLTARGEDFTQLAGFEAGADDFITKPVKPKVLISRIKALLKRYRDKDEKPVKEIIVENNSDIKIDKEKYIVYKKEQEVILPKKEFELLALLISVPEKVFTRDEIFQTVWGENVFVGDRTIDVHIRKLREKIGDNYIKTIKGVGYKFVSP